MEPRSFEIPEAAVLEIFKQYGHTFIEAFDEIFVRIPLWFKIYVSFYDNKKEIISIFNFLQIPYPEWMTNIVLPHEWSKDEIFLFLKNIHNQVCTNCNYFSRNIGYWYDNQKNNLLSPEKQILFQQHSNIPWQFIVLNPNLRDPEIIEYLQEHINDSKIYSLIKEMLNRNIFNEDNLLLSIKILKEEQILSIINTNKNVYNSIMKSEDDYLITIATKSEYSPEPPPEASSLALEKYIGSLDFPKAVEFIHNNKHFSETEKAKLLKNTFNKNYSDISIYTRLT